MAAVRDLHVLVVTAMYPSAGSPGRGTFVKEQVESLRGLGVVVDVLQIDGRRSRLAYLWAALDVFRRTYRIKYDLVHAHFGLTALFSLARWRTPLVVTLHGSDVLGPAWLQWSTRISTAFARAVIPVSRRLASRFPGEVIACGVDLRLFRPRSRAEARLRLHLPLEQTLILFPYSPGYRLKRHDSAVAVVSVLREKGVDAELLVASGVPHQEMPWYYAAADVLLVCSEHESGPLSVKESAACGCPVVSVDVGDVSEVATYWSGIKLCERSIQALADGVVSVLAKRLAPPGPEFSRYDLDSAAAAVLKLYRSVAPAAGH